MAHRIQNWAKTMSVKSDFSKIASPYARMKRLLMTTFFHSIQKSGFVKFIKVWKLVYMVLSLLFTGRIIHYLCIECLRCLFSFFPLDFLNLIMIIKMCIRSDRYTFPVLLQTTSSFFPVHSYSVRIVPFWHRFQKAWQILCAICSTSHKFLLVHSFIHQQKKRKKLCFATSAAFWQFNTW